MKPRATRTYAMLVLLTGLGAALTGMAAGQGRPDLVWMRGANRDDVIALAFSRDKSLVASGSNNHAKVWRVSDGMLLRTLPAREVNAVAFSPDGEFLATGGYGVQVWRLTDGERVAGIDGPQRSVTSVAFAPSGNLLAVGGSDGTLRLILLEGGATLTMSAHAARVSALAFLPDGETVASAGWDRRICLWRTADGTPLGSLDASMNEVNSIAISPDGLLLAAAGNAPAHNSSGLHLFRLADGALLQVKSFFRHNGHAAGFGADGQTWGGVVSIGDFARTGSGFSMWRVTDGAPVIQQQVVSLITAVLSPDSTLMATASYNNSPQSTALGVRVAATSEHLSGAAGNDPVATVAYAPDGQTLAVRRVGNVELLRPSDGRPLPFRIGPLNPDVQEHIAYSPDGQLIATGSSAQLPRGASLWRAADGALVRELPSGGFASVGSVAFSPDGRLVAGTHNGRGQVYLWRAADGALLGAIGEHHNTGYGMAIAFSPDGSLLAVRIRDGIQLWPIGGGEPIPGPGGANAMAFSPDGRLLVTGGIDGKIRFWRIPDVTLVRTLEGTTVPVAAVAFAPDGQTLLSGHGTPGALLLWRVADGTLLKTYDQEGHDDVTDIDFSPEGHSFAFVRTDGTVGRALNPFQVPVVPPRGGNTGDVTVRIFTPVDFPLAGDTLVRLIAAGQPDIEAAETEVESPRILRATFDLRGAPLGVRDVVLSPTGAPPVTLPRAFTVEEGREGGLHTEVIARGVHRSGAEQLYAIQVENRGNIDSAAADLRVQFPRFVEWRVSGGTVAETNLSQESTALSFLVPKVEAGTTRSIQIRLRVPPDQRYVGQKVHTLAWINADRDTQVSLFGGPSESLLFRTRTADGIVSDFLGSKAADGSPLVLSEILSRGEDGSLTAIHCDSQSRPVLLEAPDGTAIIIKWHTDTVEFTVVSPQGNGLAALTVPYHEDGAHGVHHGIGPPASGTGCEIACKIVKFAVSGQVCSLVASVVCKWLAGMVFVTNPVAAIPVYWLCKILTGAVCSWIVGNKVEEFCKEIFCKEPPILGAIDPNELSGPHGVNNARWMNGEHPWGYMASFENLPTATLPASEVIVNQYLNPSLYDLTTLTLGPISFGEHLVTSTPLTDPPVGLREFNAEVDLGRPVDNLLVHVNAKLDMLTGQLIWRFVSLDPVTRQPPDDPLLGFLPPGVGGSCLFSVLPKRNLPTGTEIATQASIVFDFNPPLATNVWMNTIDATPPVTNVPPLAATQNRHAFRVEWAGSDVGAGVQDAALYVSDNGGPWTLWLANLAEPSATYVGLPGHTYAFYSVGRDHVGNIEAAPAEPDAVTTVANTNLPPVANAGPDQTVGAFGPETPVVLDGSASSDADGDPLSYAWHLGQALLGEEATPVVALPVGDHEITLTVTDTSGATGQDSVRVVVRQTLPPAITCPPDVTVGNDPGRCDATVDPGAATAVDPVEGPLTPVGTRGDGQPLTAPYPAGTTTITWMVTNSAGLSASCPQTVTVEDREAPQVTGLSVDRPVLWPANRRMVTVTLNYGTSDNCDAAGGIATQLAVTSNEPERVGRRDRAPDWEVVDARHVRLRAERLPRGGGRVYTLSVTATDARGNASTQTVTVTVPRRRPPRARGGESGITSQALPHPVGQQGRPVPAAAGGQAGRTAGRAGARDTAGTQHGGTGKRAVPARRPAVPRRVPMPR